MLPLHGRRKILRLYCEEWSVYGLLVRRKILRLYRLEPLYVNVLWEIMI